MKDKFLFLSIIFCLIYPSLSSALLVSIPLEKSIDDADYIVVAEVVGIQSQREEFRKNINLVMSAVTLRVMENWKNSVLEDQIKIRSFGGFLDGSPYFSDNDPIFIQGQKIILFLKNYDGELFPLYHKQGVYLVDDAGNISGMNQSILDFKNLVMQVQQQ